MQICNVHLFDGEQRHSGLFDIHIEGDRIKSVIPHASVGTTDAPDVIDGAGGWLLPGLIDLHVHLSWNGGADPATDISNASAEENLLETVSNALNYLPHGITSVRDLGTPHDAALHVGKAIARGKLPGPRIFSSGMSLIMTGGHDPFHGLPVDGPWEALKGVRRQVAQGAQVIKISATGGVYGRTEGEGVDDTELRKEELEMIMDEAHRRHVPVTAHAIGEMGIRACLAAGIDCIEHGHFIQPDMAQQMAAQGIALVPTFYVYQHLAASPTIPAYARQKAVAVTEQHRRALGYARQAGVLIGAGSDAGSPDTPHPALLEEILALEDGGLSRIEALCAATGNAGRILGCGGRLGTVRPGAFADLILLNADPCQNLHALRDIRLVIAAGRPHQC